MAITWDHIQMTSEPLKGDLIYESHARIPHLGGTMVFKFIQWGGGFVWASLAWQPMGFSTGRVAIVTVSHNGRQLHSWRLTESLSTSHDFTADPVNSVPRFDEGSFEELSRALDITVVLASPLYDILMEAWLDVVAVKRSQLREDIVAEMVRRLKSVDPKQTVLIHHDGDVSQAWENEVAGPIRMWIEGV